MKLLPLFFSMVASTACGAFAVTSWAVEGTDSPAAASVQSHQAARETASGAQPADERQTLDKLASDGADHVGANHVASDGADHVGANRVASDGSDHVGANRVADGGYRTSAEIRVANTGESPFNHSATSSFCGPCR
ncbi:hypothetical protein CFII64_28589 [Pseudomonas sp. CFII64]|nr:hypothetical protein CFII64_28589 [Pseudomonas sp. CFII64]